MSAVRIKLLKPYRGMSIGDCPIVPAHVAKVKCDDGSAVLPGRPAAGNKMDVPADETPEETAKQRKRREKAERKAEKKAAKDPASTDDAPKIDISD